MCTLSVPGRRSTSTLVITSQTSFIRFVWTSSSRGPHMQWVKINTASSWIRCELTNTTDASYRNYLFPLIHWSKLWRRMETRVHIFLSFVKLQKENMMCQPEGWATDHYEADKQTAELSVLDSIKVIGITSLAANLFSIIKHRKTLLYHWCPSERFHEKEPNGWSWLYFLWRKVNWIGNFPDLFELMSHKILHIILTGVCRCQPNDRSCIYMSAHRHLQLHSVGWLDSCWLESCWKFTRASTVGRRPLTLWVTTEHFTPIVINIIFLSKIKLSFTSPYVSWPPETPVRLPPPTPRAHPSQTNPPEKHIRGVRQADLSESVSQVGISSVTDQPLFSQPLAKANRDILERLLCF